MDRLCRIRDIYRSIMEFEGGFEKRHGLCLNEGMLLCSLSKSEMLTSGDIAKALGLTNSNASKVIRSVEQKGFIHRVMGSLDKRQMYFTLTSDGVEKIEAIKKDKYELPEMLNSIF